MQKNISKIIFILALVSSLLLVMGCEKDKDPNEPELVLDGVDVLLINTWDTYELQVDGDILIPVIAEEQSMVIAKHDMILAGVSVKPEDSEIYFEDNQIYTLLDEEKSYIYDYFYNTSSKALWLKSDLAMENTIVDSLGAVISPLDLVDVDLNDFTLYFVNGHGPELTLIEPVNEYKINTLDPDFEWEEYVGADQYEIMIALDEEFENVVVDDTDNNESYGLDDDLVNFTTYYWKVKADNSVWSDTWSFTTNYVVSLEKPQNDKSASLKPKFQWDDLDGATNYTLQVSASGDFDSFIVNETITETEYNIAEYLDENTTYYWRVKTNTSGENWSEIWLFHTDIVVALGEPQDETTEIAVPVVFEWTQLDNAANYTIQVSTDEDFEDIVLDEEVPAAGTWTDSGNLTANPYGYYWRITSDVAVGWSEVRTFVTNDGVFLFSPNDNASAGALVKFDWNSYSGATGYQVQVATDEAFTSMVLDKDVTWEDDEITEYLTEDDLEFATNYFWRVKALESNWSEVREFLTITDVIAEEVELTYPLNNAVDDIVQQSPTFMWERLGSSSFYRIQISETENFDNPLLDHVGDAKSYTVSSDDAFDYDAVYYWRVRSDKNNWGTPWAIHIKSGVPTADQFNKVGDFAYKIDLEWADRTTAETGFEIERSMSESGPFELIGTCNADYDNYVDYNRDAETTYWYRGRTLSAVDTSAYWTPISVTTAAFDFVNTPEMISVAAGTFDMGSADGDSDESPVHAVTLTNDISVAKTEITNAQFAEAINWALAKGYISNAYNPVSQPIAYEDGEGTNNHAELQSKFIKPGGNCLVTFSSIQKMYTVEGGLDSYPVTDITWFGAALYSNVLSLINGKTEVYDFWTSDVYGANGYRLPTEAEWEYVASYNDGRNYPWGNDEPTHDHANFYNVDVADNGLITVGALPQGNSNLGIQDLAGNVWEWCNDIYDADYYTSGSMTDPTGPATSTSTLRNVIRGGSWEMAAGALRNANRSMCKPDLAYGRSNTSVGFRVVFIN